MAGHLGVAAGEYDRAIRTFIPDYEDMQSTIVRWLHGHIRPEGLVVDLGAGTGALSMAILDAMPAVRVQLVDVDPAMLEVASERCRPHAGRFDVRRGAFADPLPRCDAVVAALALHHAADLGEKRALYRSIHDALEAGGMLVVGDVTVHEKGPERGRMFADWAVGMQRHGISAAEAAQHFAQWADEDRYFPLAVELEAIGAAGFAHPECFWKIGALTVFGGFKDGEVTEPDQS